MKKTVAHFIRKNTQLRSSFIKNQITNHINYKPVVIYRYNSTNEDGVFADLPIDIPTFNLAENKKFDLNFRYLKHISKSDTTRILKYLETNKAAILHLHYGSDACIYADVIKSAGIPSIVSFYGYDSSSFDKFLFGFGRYLLKNRIFNFVNRVFAMSEDMKNDLINIGCPEEKIIVHYYGTDVKKFYDHHIFKNEKIVTYLIISGLEPQKGHIFLLKSFKLAYSHNQNIRLKIFGSGSIEEDIKNYICKNDMQNYVQMLGKLNYGSERHREQLEIADVFIHPSVTAQNGDKEGIPGAIVEAMAAGLPVISTYHAGIPYIIQNEKTGMLVKEWDVTHLSEAILSLADNLNSRMELGIEAQKYAIKNLDLHKKEIELEEIYSNLINDKKQKETKIRNPLHSFS